MNLHFDHIVVAVDDLERAIANYKSLGFNPVRGGGHTNGVRHNALIFLSDGTYIELVAWLKPDPNRDDWAVRYERSGEGYLDYCLASHSIDTDVAAAHAAGVGFNAPKQGGRVRPDGEQVTVFNARPTQFDLPFLCQDITKRGVRIQEGEVRTQPNGVMGISAITVVVKDLARSVSRTLHLIGSTQTTNVQEAIIAGTKTLNSKFKLPGGVNVSLAAPLDDAGELAELLAVRGEGPFSIELEADSGFDVADHLAHGARWTITECKAEEGNEQ
ncbi:VOC family protein [Rhizobium sp. LEGMi135b]